MFRNKIFKLIIILNIFFLFLVIVGHTTIKVNGVELKTDNLDLVSDSKSAILIEVSTGEIVYEKNSKEKRFPASLTKIMTMILVMEAIHNNVISYDTIFTASEKAKSMGGTTIFLETGEEISVSDLLKGVAITSANDAAVCLAEGINGTVQEFVRKMNDKALKIGCVNTHFSNCNGLPVDNYQENHYTCAYDIGLMSTYLVKTYPDILKFTSIYEDYLRKGTDREFWLVNTNKLVRFYDSVDGLKTGWTIEAGYCLSATQKVNDIRFVAVAMGASSAGIRNKEIMTMLNYGANNYELKNIVKDGELIDIKNNILYKPYKYNIVTSDSLNIIIKKGEKLGNISKDIIIYDDINDNIVGKMKLKYDEKTIIIDLVSDEKVEKANVFEILFELFKRILL